MDFLDRLEENEERYRAMRRREPRQTAEPKPKHDITIIGVIRAVDGWYCCGFDEQTKTIVPLERIEKITQLYNFECSVCRDNGWEGLRKCFKKVYSDTLPKDEICPYDEARPNWKFTGTYPPTKTTMKETEVNE